MKRLATILLALFIGFALDGVVAASHDASAVSSAVVKSETSGLTADVVAQIDCARTYNSDLKLPSVPSVSAPQHVQQASRNDSNVLRRVVGTSEVRAAGAGRCYVSTKSISRLCVGSSPSGYAIRMLCRLII